MRTTPKILIYFFSVLAGVLIYLTPLLGVLYLYIALALALVLFVRVKCDPSDRRFLTAMLILMVVSRFFISLVYMKSRGEVLSQDEGLYSQKALYMVYQEGRSADLSDYFVTYFNDPDLIPGGYGVNAYSRTLAAFYKVFGYQIQSARLINAFISLLVFTLLFWLSKLLYGSRTAKLASGLYAVFPSLALWSVTIGTDMYAILGIVLCVLSMVQLTRRATFLWLAAFAASLFLVEAVRHYMMTILLTVASITVFAHLWYRLRRGIRYAAVCLGILLCFTIVSSPLFQKVTGKVGENMEVMIKQQQAFAKDDQAGYLVFPAHCYKTLRCGLIDFLSAEAKGLGYLFFSPFPWNIESSLQFIAYPQVVAMFFMFPFMLYGAYRGLRSAPGLTLPVILYSLIGVLFFSVVEGNIGALFRHKDMVTPFLIIFFSYGVNTIFLRDE